MAKLKELQLRALRPADHGTTLRDGAGVLGKVYASKNGGAISVRFSLRYKAQGRQREIRLGTWPDVTLAAMRRERDRAKEDIRNKVDPAERRLVERLKVEAAGVEARRRLAEEEARAEAERIANRTVQNMFDDWIADGVARKDGNAEIRRMFGKDVLPAIGAKPVREVTEHDLRAILRALVARGVNRTAVRCYHDLVQMFGWAERRQPWRGLMADGNPALLIEIDKIVAPDFDLSGERERVLSADEIRELRDIFEKMEANYAAAPYKYQAVRPLRKESQIALWVSLGTACRIGELLMAEWAHVDLERGEWFIPKENAKGARGKKQDQIVFLSNFVLRQFHALHALTGKSKWCFPARNRPDADEHVCVKSVSKQVGDRQERFKNRKPLKNRQNNNTLVLADGANGDWTPHDMRRTAATWMQALGISPDVIDRCQNHVMKGNRVRRHYLHHDYANEKREAWRRLGERIDAVLAENVVIFPARAAVA